MPVISPGPTSAAVQVGEGAAAAVQKTPTEDALELQARLALAVRFCVAPVLVVPMTLNWLVSPGAKTD
jgi:hypothetical protein